MSACAAEDCHNPLPLGRRKWCSAPCMERTHSRIRRGTDSVGKGLLRPRTVAMWEMRREMDAAGGKGRCIFCEGRMPPLRRLHCGAEACEADYQHMYHLGEMAEAAEAEARRRPVLTCAWAPCSRPFPRREGGGAHAFCSETCQQKDAYQRRKAKREKAQAA